MRRRVIGGRWASGIIPVELCDFDSAVWLSRSASRSWLSARGVDVTDRRFDSGPLNRHDLALEAWALAFGPTKPASWGSHRDMPDWEQLAGLGVVRSRASARVDEVFAAAGVRVEA